MSDQLLFAERAYLPEGWARDVLLRVSAAGDITALETGAQVDARAEGATRLAGPVLPGMPNLHSHAFQRAMAGLAERAGESDDSFWTWREVMYGFLGRITPEHIEAIASQLYVEMLKAGYTAVAEFHYLHHDADGEPYQDLAETSRRVMAAAGRSGIGLTHLPVLYGFSGFGGAEASHGQRRFLNDPERFLRLLEEIFAAVRDDPQMHAGIAPHSLRAVTLDSLGRVLEGLERLDPTAPVHVHIAEQQKEVHDCIEWSGLRPVEWLLANCPVDPRWCLIHATHSTDREAEQIAASGAVAGLCPTTEANLGDGLFPAVAFLEAGGRFGIGSDSHISISPIEELRWLEYGQRLTVKRRNLLTGGPDRRSVGTTLFEHALAGGAQALGRPIGRLAEGCRADLLVLDPDCPILVERSDELLLDAVIFAGNLNPVRDVMVGGRWRVRGGHHDEEDAIFQAYRAALNTLMA